MSFTVPSAVGHLLGHRRRTGRPVVATAASAQFVSEGDHPWVGSRPTSPKALAPAARWSASQYGKSESRLMNQALAAGRVSIRSLTGTGSRVPWLAKLRSAPSERELVKGVWRCSTWRAQRRSRSAYAHSSSLNDPKIGICCSLDRHQAAFVSEFDQMALTCEPCL